MCDFGDVDLCCRSAAVHRYPGRVSFSVVSYLGGGADANTTTRGEGLGTANTIVASVSLTPHSSSIGGRGVVQQQGQRQHKRDPVRAAITLRAPKVNGAWLPRNAETALYSLCISRYSWVARWGRDACWQSSLC